MAVYRIVAGVLYLSNVAFEAGADGNALVTNEEVLTPCCALLKADPDILETTLTFRNMATARATAFLLLCLSLRVHGAGGLFSLPLEFRSLTKHRCDRRVDAQSWSFRCCRRRLSSLRKV